MNDAASTTIIEQVLRSLGVDDVCVRVYLAMHESPRTTDETLAGRLNLGLADVADAVNTLAALSLLRPGVDPSSGPRAVGYERAIQTLLRQHSEQLILQRESLETLQSSMKEFLASPHDLQAPANRIDADLVTGTEEIHSLLEGTTFRTNQTFVAISPSMPAPKEVLEAARPNDEGLLTRGVAVRVIYHYSVLADSRNLQYAKWFSSVGAQLRRSPVLPPRFIIADETTAFVPISHTRPANQLLVVREPGLIALLVELFEATWAAAEPLDGAEATALDENKPSSQELALLRILAAGGTDEAAAKKLGVSVRTIRRIMADLMERLGATSRFEAGHRATQRGWL